MKPIEPLGSKPDPQRRTLIMGILNATPDSFSGDGSVDTDTLVRRGLLMQKWGADILDIGGESSRPFSDKVSVTEEIRRVIPVITSLRKRTSIPISIDTYHPETAEIAISEGATLINDITGMINPEMRRLAAEKKAQIVIMHMKGQPADMQLNPKYENVLTEVQHFFQDRIEKCMKSGLNPSKIILDPGIGFGKRLEHNLLLIQNIDVFKKMGFPILIGVSRKSFIGDILGTEVNNRLEGTLAAVAASVFKGVDIVRVHDVKSIARFLVVLNACVNEQSNDHQMVKNV